MSSGPRRPSRRLWVLVAGGAALGVLAALIGLRMTPTVYRATATLLVAPSEASLNQSYQRTYAQMAVHPVVLGRVRDLLGLGVPVGRLEEAVTARPIPETQLVEIAAQASDAATARQIADTTARVFVDQQADQLPFGPGGPTLRIGQPAALPEQPMGPRPLPGLLIGLVIGAAVGLVVSRLIRRPAPLPTSLEWSPSLPGGAAAAAPSAMGDDGDGARTPVGIAAAPEPIRAADIFRGLVAVVAAGVLLVWPLLQVNRVSSPTSGARLETPIAELAAATAPAPPTSEPRPTAPPQSAVIPTITDMPLGPIAPSPGGSASGSQSADAEIAGATSAAPTAGQDATAVPQQATAATQAPAAAPPISSLPGPAGSAGTAPLFEARFDGSQALWPNNAAGPARFEEGGYRIASSIGQFAAIGAPVDQPMRDVVVAATFRKAGGPPGGVYGLIIRDAGPLPRDGSNQTGNFYVLGIDDRGQYAVSRRDDDRWIDVVPLTPSDAIRSGQQSNDLSVTAIDDRLTLSVNGTEVATVLGALPRAGRVGIYVAGDSNDVVVTRFEVRPPTTNNAPPVAAQAETPPTAPAEVAGVAESRELEARAAMTRAPAGFTSAFLREAPTAASRALASLPNGTVLEVLPETAAGDGFTWLRVRTSTGTLGWVVSTAVAG